MDNFFDVWFRVAQDVQWRSSHAAPVGFMA